MIPQIQIAKICIIIALILASIYGQDPQENRLILSGESSNDLAGIESVGKSKSFSKSFDFGATNRLSLYFRSLNSEAAKIEGNFDFWLFTGNYANKLNSIDSTASFQIVQRSSLFLFDIRKLYASLYFPFADVSIGRQIITFGQGAIFSPVDVFSKVNIFDLSLRRYGSDVARVRIPFGELSGLDAIAKLTWQQQESAMALKAYSNLAGADIAGIVIYRSAQNELITGITFKGDLIAGVYLEIVERWIKDNNRFTCVIGADYSVRNVLLFSGEYLFNQKPEDKLSIEQSTPLNAVIPLLHNHYGFMKIRYNLNDLMNASISAIVDFPGKSGIATIQYFYNAFQNTNTILYVQGYYGASQGILMLPFDQVKYGLRVDIAF